MLTRIVQAARFMLDSEAESYLKEKNTVDKCKTKEASHTTKVPKSLFHYGI